MRKYEMLRRELAAIGVRQEDLRELIGVRSRTVLSGKYTAKQPWTQEEMYRLLDLIGQPYSRMHIYFPRGGVQRPEELPFKRQLRRQAI